MSHPKVKKSQPVIVRLANFGENGMEMELLFWADQSWDISNYKSDIRAANFATELGLGINAGHDLSLENLKFFKTNIPQLAEVSIGHALISDALYFGLENTIQRYKLLLI